jgi:hypothetical protein
MLIHRKDGEYTTERQGWKEFFMVEVSWAVAKMEGVMEVMPWYLVKGETNYARGVDRYWAFYLMPAIWIKFGAMAAWIYPAKQANKWGWLEVPNEGVMPSWFWPKYLKIFKKNGSKTE